MIEQLHLLISYMTLCQAYIYEAGSAHTLVASILGKQVVLPAQSRAGAYPESKIIQLSHCVCGNPSTLLGCFRA